MTGTEPEAIPEYDDPIEEEICKFVKGLDRDTDHVGGGKKMARTRAVLIGFLALFALFLTFPLCADQKATTEGGKTVLLKDDGTWEYIVLQGPSQGIGKWTVNEKVNPVDDSRLLTFVLIADEGKGRFGGSIGLLLRYMSQKTEVFIAWGSYLGSEAYVLTRCGDRPASTVTWSLSTDKKATFYPGPALPFIHELLNVDRLVAQVTPYGESPVTAIFDVRGLQEAIAPYNDLLGWE